MCFHYSMYMQYKTPCISENDTTYKYKKGLAANSNSVNL